MHSRSLKFLMKVVKIFVLSLLIFSVVLFSGPSIVFSQSEDWWDPYWSYRRAILIDNTGNSENLIDYQVFLDIDYESDMRFDFGDLRFIQDGQTLDYWMNKTVGGSYAKVWVEVAMIPADSTTIIYMYYGNPTETSLSSFEDTMTKNMTNRKGLVLELMFDEGSGSIAYDTSGKENHASGGTFSWNTEDLGYWDGQTNVKFSGSSIELDDGASWRSGSADWLRVEDSPSLHTTDLTIMAWFEISAFDSTHRDIVEKSGATWPWNGFWFDVPTGTRKGRFMLMDHTRWNIQTATTIQTTTVYMMTATYNQATRDMRLYLGCTEEAFMDEGPPSITWGNEPLWIGTWEGGKEFMYGFVDDVRIFNRTLTHEEIRAWYERRVHTDLEPTVTIGNKETIGEPPPNTPPVASDLVITPSSPVTSDDLVGSYVYSDFDGDPENGSEIRWYKDDVLQPLYNDTLTVLSSSTDVGQVWHFTVRPKDGEDFGDLQTSPTVTVIEPPPNTPPVASDLVITPSSPVTSDDLVGSYVYSDFDGDPENGSEIRWYKDDVLQPLYNDTLTVLSSSTDVGQVWHFTVRPKDGEDFGDLQTSPTVTVSNISRIFSDEFETGDFSAWTGTSATAVDSVTVVTEQAYQGLYSSKSVIMGGGRAHPYKVFTEQPILFTRGYFRFATIPLDATIHIVKLWDDTRSSAIAILSLQHVSGYGYRFVVYDFTSHRTYSGSWFNLGIDMWYSIEWKYVEDVSSGEYRAWLDGTEALTATGLNTSANPSAGTVDVGLVHYSKGDHTLYLDSVVVAEKYIGT